MSIVSDIIYAGVGLLSAPFWGYRLLRTGKWRTDWRGRFGHTANIPHDRPTLLLHAVSVGEVNTARQLVDELERRYGERLRIVVSVTTDTGTARASELFSPRHTVVRYPLDFTRCVRRFLDAVKPDAVGLMELEVWPTFVGQCTRRGVKVAVLNGRLSERSFRRYRLIRWLIRGAFGQLAVSAVQDEDYRRRFIVMGAAPDRVHVTGTMKWDGTSLGAPDEKLLRDAGAMADAMGIDRSLPLIVCGSTADGEEALIVDHVAGLERGGRPVQVLVAPRKPERFDEVAQTLPGCVRRSRSPDGTFRAVGQSRYFLLDTIGELRKAYALADVAVIGRTFAPLFGSNMIEPIALGKATIVGPDTRNFRDQMQKLLEGGGIVQVSDGPGLRAAVQRLLAPAEAGALVERGYAVVAAQQGATARHADLLARLLPGL